MRRGLRSEDAAAIAIGALLLSIGLGIYLGDPPAQLRETLEAANATIDAEAQRAPFKTVAWHRAVDRKTGLQARKQGLGAAVAPLVGKPGKWKHSPLRAFGLAAASGSKHEAQGQRAGTLEAAARKAEDAAATARFEDVGLNGVAEEAIAAWRTARLDAKAAKKKARPPRNQLPWLAGLCVLLALLFGWAARSVDEIALRRFVPAFAGVFGLALVAWLFAGQATLKHYGIGYAAWAIALGLLISNTLGTPAWLQPAVRTELYIKTGLVLLGAEVLFGKILAIGTPGIFVAWVVTPVVLLSTYWFGQRILKMGSKTLNITICADMSVCGVSAAIATAAACRAKREELTLAVGLSLVFTSIMMVVMPAVIRALGMDEVLGGAWIGGTIDATGAVAAAGAFLGDQALQVAATIKMIQNVLIGVIAFGVAVYWAARVDGDGTRNVGAGEIWRRFPKFVLGFIGASLLFSALHAGLGSDVAYSLLDQGVLRGWSKSLRGWCFCLAFVSIGLQTDFRQLREYFSGGKPLVLYVVGQSLNLALTLLMAWVMFYLVFPEVTQGL